MAITFVQSALSTEGSTTAATQVTMTNVAGNALVALLGNDGGTISSVTDTLGNTWLPIAAQNGTGGHIAQGFYVLNCKGGVNTITGNFSVGPINFAQFAVGEWNPGAGNQFLLDASTSGLGTVTSQDTSPALTTTKAPSVVIAAYGDGNTNVTAVSGGFTGRTTRGASTRCGIADDITATTGTFQAAITPAGASAQAWYLVNFYTGVLPPTSTAYSVPDCRTAPFGPNASRTVQNTKIYDVQTSSNSTVPGTDSRVQGAPVDCRISPNIPQNSRAPGTYGPGE